MAMVKRTPLAEQAADLLLDRIRSGEWGLGEKLPGETTLAPQLGVGRSTVREAIRQLAGRGVLITRQGSGVFVNALDAQESWDSVLRRTDITLVIEARIAIEAESAGLAAARRTPEDLRAIRQALTERAGRRTEVADHVDADTAFHRAVVAAAHNPVLLELFDGFTPRLREAMIEMLRIKKEFGSDDDHAVHERIADAIEAGDADSAAECSRTHLLALRESLLPQT